MTTATTAPARPLTPRQLAILDTIRRRHADRQQALTPRQIAAHTGISASIIHAELKRLRELGWLRPAGTDTTDSPSAVTDGPVEATEAIARPVLTPRQREILTLASEGLTDAEIGQRLWLTEAGTKKHLHRIYVTLGATNRAHSVAIALRTGIIR